MKESEMTLKENSTTLVFLLSNCKQVPKILYDPLNIISIYDYSAIGSSSVVHIFHKGIIS